MIKILIVDDDAALCSLLKNFLQKNSIESDCLYNGEEALMLLLSPECTCYDLILMDVSMPGKSGLEVLRAVRANAIGIPVIMLSGSTDPEDKFEALKYAADDYVRKPCDQRELVTRIDAVLRRAKTVSEG